jgi:hypothetical protein
MAIVSDPVCVTQLRCATLLALEGSFAQAQPLRLAGKQQKRGRSETQRLAATSEAAERDRSPADKGERHRGRLRASQDADRECLEAHHISRRKQAATKGSPPLR